MGLKLKEYINDSNRKLDKETVRKHLVDILNYTVEENSFLDQMTVGKRLYSNQYKNSPSVSLTNEKIKKEVTGVIKQNSNYYCVQ
ncbi:hypothetical protein ACRCGN_14655, partial [Staphylococcus aureus]